MVVQSYAIWPHMTVFENVADPLRVRGVKGSRAREQVQRILNVVGLAGLEDRPATALSGGQQQRVALARSLVFEPRILLLDEPFSNLDAKLREQMRAELRVLQRRLGITVLFVTHDQIEALSLSDRIAVMSQGRIEQIGSPLELYRAPQTPIVRDFLGRTVVLAAIVTRADTDGALTVALGPGDAGEFEASAGDAAGLSVGDACCLAIRPEQVRIAPEEPGQPAQPVRNRLDGIIEALLFVGERYEARMMLPGGESMLVYLPPTIAWHENQSVSLHFPRDQVRVWRA
jgi:ABC-type Fe3+/spermidine/putrescine transport system ATPase subunit